MHTNTRRTRTKLKSGFLAPPLCSFITFFFPIFLEVSLAVTIFPACNTPPYPPMRSGSSSGLLGARVITVLIGFILVLRAVEAAPPRPTVHHFKWEVEYVFWAPDCVENPVMAINGQFPGPTIRAKAGDIVHVDLTNKLSTEGVVIHWHGIRQV